MNNLHDIRNSRKRKAALKKERIIMLSASAFVLAALTMTGVYVREKNKDNDEYRVDLSELDEGQAGKVAEEIAKDLTTTPIQPMNVPDDLDADPYYQETGNTNNIINPQFSNTTAQIAEQNAKNPPAGKKYKDVTNKKSTSEPEKQEETQPVSETSTESVETVETNETAVSYSFLSDKMIHLPMTGEVLLNFSMDQPIHFETLNQYKYNPAVMISAVIGEQVTAAASGVVLEVGNTAELGNIMRMDIGGGYEITYGQLDDICVAVGQVVNVGDNIGKIAEPSVFYTVEGSNLYLKMTCNQIPENPLAYIQ